MRRIIMVVAAMCSLWMGAMAQESQMATWSWGARSCQMDVESMMNGQYVGTVGEQDCWLTRTSDGPKSFVRRDDWQVLRTRFDMTVAGRLELPKTNYCRVLTAVMDGNRLGVLLVDSSDEKSTVVLKAVVDMDSMVLVGHRIDTLARFDYNKGDRCMVWAATSENKEHTGVLSVVENNKEKTYVAEVHMLDRTLKTEWKVPYAVGSTNSVGVSDKGELVTLGYNPAGLEMSVINSKEGFNYKMELSNDRLEEMQVMRVSGRKAICGGLYASHEGHRRNYLVGGVVTMALGLDSADVLEVAYRAFDNSDVNNLTNVKMKKKQRRMEVPMVDLLGWTPTEDGGVVMMVGHKHRLQITQSNGNLEQSFVAQGMLLLAMDNNGDFRWKANIRRNDLQEDEDNLLFAALFSDGDKVRLVKSEHRSMPMDYNIAKPAKEYEIGDKGNLVMYCIDGEGNVTKDVLKKKTRMNVATAARLDNGKVAVMALDGKTVFRIDMGSL